MGFTAKKSENLIPRFVGFITKKFFGNRISHDDIILNVAKT